MKKVLFLVLLCVVAQQASAAKKVAAKNNKFGASRIVFNEATFTIRSNNVQYSAVKPLTGTAVFYEHIFGDYFSFGLHYGMSMNRNIEDTAGDSVETVVNIQESVDYAAYDLKAFLSSNRTGGIKLYIGGGQGMMNVVSNITTRSATGVSTKEEVSTTVPVTYGTIGVDIFAKRSSAGFRLEASSVSAEKTETSNGTLAVYGYTGIGYSLAIFYRF